MRVHSHALGREVEFETHEDGSATIEGILYGKRELALMKRKTAQAKATHHHMKLLKKHGFDPELLSPEEAAEIKKNEINPLA